jgi:diguanylate cyclase (GGDEF)-like protein/PAS domain S-box-containing protein
MSRLPAVKVSKEDIERAVGQTSDLSLFAPGGPFEHYPGAVLLSGRNGIVLAANQAADSISRLLQRGRSIELREAINSAVAGKAAQINPLVLEGEPGNERATAAGAVVTQKAFDVAVLPWVDGTAALVIGRDITLERSLRSALIESRQRYKDLVEAASDFAWETDAEGHFTFVSAEGALGYSAAELIGVRADELVTDRAGFTETPFTTSVPLEEIEVWVRRTDGESACLTVTALPLTDTEGAWCGARGLCRNITDERRQEVQLAGDRHRERLLAYILGIVRDEMDPAHMLNAAADVLVPALPVAGACIYRLERDGEILCAAQSGELGPDYLVQEALRDIAEMGAEDELELNCREGSLFAKATRFQGACNGVLLLWRAGQKRRPWNEADHFLLKEVAGQLGLANRQLAREEELEQLSSTDPLTGLLNRRSFTQALERIYLGAVARPGGSGALFYLDLDNFKLVNDRHGHQQGDLALMSLASILQEHTRGRDLIGRLGGDEFAIFMEDMSAETAEQKACELLAAGRELQRYSGSAEAPLGLSIGIALCEGEARESLEALFERADQTMYRVKQDGKGGFKVSLPGEGGGS